MRPAALCLRRDPPSPTAPLETVDRGRALYELYCTQGNGHSVVGGGVVLDLRYSPTVSSRDSHASVGLDGSKITNGMFSSEQFL